MATCDKRWVDVPDTEPDDPSLFNKIFPPSERIRICQETKLINDIAIVAFRYSILQIIFKQDVLVPDKNDLAKKLNVPVDNLIITQLIEPCKFKWTKNF